MIVRTTLAALLLACAALPAQAQEFSADQLVAKNLEARGGGGTLSGLRSVRLQGRIIFPGDFELTYKEVRARADSGAVRSRTDLSLQGLDVVQAYDGTGGWKINPFQGRKDPERMSNDEAQALADSSLLEGALLASTRDGSQVAYLGREDFDGTNAYKLRVTQKDGDQFVYLLDPDTFLEIKIDETRRIRGAPQTTEYELGDYEKIGGVYFPMSIESWQQGQTGQRTRLLIAEGEANPAFDAALFNEPRAGASAPPGGSPPDASTKSQDDPVDPAKPADASNPPKGE